MGKSAGEFCGKGKDINGIVAELGCVVKVWGFAYFCLLFYEDRNYYRISEYQ